jgi:hypothetical protein
VKGLPIDGVPLKTDKNDRLIGKLGGYFFLSLLLTIAETIVTISPNKAISSKVLISTTPFPMYCPDVAEVWKEKRNTAYRLVSLRLNYTLLKPFVKHKRLVFCRL